MSDESHHGGDGEERGLRVENDLHELSHLLLLGPNEI
jgi:hypothetical protein